MTWRPTNIFYFTYKASDNVVQNLLTVNQSFPKFFITLDLTCRLVSKNNKLLNKYSFLYYSDIVSIFYRIIIIFFLICIAIHTRTENSSLYHSLKYLQFILF